MVNRTKEVSLDTSLEDFNSSRLFLFRQDTDPPLPPQDPFWFIRLKNAPGFARGFSRHKSGVQWYLPMTLSRSINWSRLEKRSQALRGRNLTRDIQAPVRQWRVRPLMAFVTRGRSLESHWTPDLCLRKSCGAAAFATVHTLGRDFR